MKQNMNIFNQVEVKVPQSNVFDLTHDVKMSGRMGNLYPVLALDVVPGDKITLGADTLVRFAPLIAPVMHRMNVTIHYFFCPNRLVWENWEKWITTNSEVPPIQPPVFTINGSQAGTQEQFLDYMGIPPWTQITGATNATNINALPIAAYQKIYNDWYRDQNLIAEVPTMLQDGVNVDADFLVLRKRAYEHDYFTASLPFAQKGAAVDIPLGVVELDPAFTGTPQFVDNTGAVYTGPVISNLGDINVNVPPQSPNLAYDPAGSLSVGSTTINDLRRAFKLQEWLEKNARGGTRYIESILMHFGVRSSDKRLQRPEYITGCKSPVIISEVLNTTGEDGGLPQGNMAGHGVSVGEGYSGSYYAEEHGYIIGILSVMPKPAYGQGIPRHFLRLDPLDYYWPSFANIGEQEVTEQEIYAYQSTKDSVWGYVPRYAEYKYMPSRIAGDFRTSLDYWHLARLFTSAPALNQTFLEPQDGDIDRPFAVNDTTDNLYMHILHKIKAVRRMPVFGTPMI